MDHDFTGGNRANAAPFPTASAVHKTPLRGTLQAINIIADRNSDPRRRNNKILMMKDKKRIGFVAGMAAVLLLAGCSTTTVGRRETTASNVDPITNVEPILNDKSRWLDAGGREF